MPQLGNTRHERFARFIAKGHCKSKAYILAGYTANKGNAARLWNNKGKSSERIKARVKELVTKAADLSAQDILDNVLATYNLAIESGQCSAALKACEMLGKEMGLFRDRRESVNINLNAMSLKQTEEYLTEKYGDRAKSLLDWLKTQYYPSIERGENKAESGPLGVVDQPTRAPYLVSHTTYSDDD